MLPDLLEERRRFLTRRWFFRDCGVGLGTIALQSLLGGPSQAAPVTLDPLAPRKPPQPATAKRVIYLFIGAPSHLELFDYKPELEKWNGKLPPAELF